MVARNAGVRSRMSQLGCNIRDLTPVASVADVLERVAARLAEASCETPKVDAELLVAHALGTTRTGLHVASRRNLTPQESERLDELVARREQREPLAYILGGWGFRRLSLRVDRRVLVPRPETEVVVERCLAAIEALAEPRVLDVGTGSGAIALAIADEHPGTRVTAVDSSADALAVASKNAELNGVHVDLVRWDLFDGLPRGPWDLVVSNPPYVEPSEIERLEPEVREWEPRDALVAVGATEAIARSALDVLAPRRTLVVETADGAAHRIADYLRGLGYEQVRITPDLAGRDRVVEGVRP